MNINRVVLTGNLTRDPELRATPGGLSVCKLGIAVNTRRKNGQTGEWEEKPNYFRVTVFGRQADSCGQYLSKGRPVAIDGRLEWSQYESEGVRRESIEIIADTVQFLAGRDDTASTGTNQFRAERRDTESDVPIDVGDFDIGPAVSIAGQALDDDIPF
ncbi:MAG: single-stranded DNA-binding protein [Solirubrobacteraceae bacterium]